MLVHGPSNNVQEVFWTTGYVPAAPPAGQTFTKVVFTVNLGPNQQADPSNRLRFRVFADTGLGPLPQPQAVNWQGGPGAPAPQAVYAYDPAHPPAVVYLFVENGSAGPGSETNVTGITAADAA